MDDVSMLSSRSAAMDALANLSSSHARLHGLAQSLVDRLFPGDGSTRDEAIVPFANLAFIALTKARADLETYAKSFAEVLKTVDAVRPPTTSAAAPPPTAATTGPQDPNGQNESVGMLKRKYEEGLAATGPAPKKAGMGPPQGGPRKMPLPKQGGAKQVAAPANANANNGATSPRQAQLPPPLSPSTATTSSELTSSMERELPKSPKDEAVSPKSPKTSAAAPAGLPAPLLKHSDTMSASEDGGQTPRSPKGDAKTEGTETSSGSGEKGRGNAGSSVNPTIAAPVATKEMPKSDPTNKEAMKQALATMVLPGRKKTASPLLPTPPATAGTSGSSSAKVGEGVASSDQSEDSKSGGAGKVSKSNTGTTSDDDISSDEEEYLRGVEERRARAAAEKEERSKAAKDQREARQTMYAFLTEEPPPGFIAKPSHGAAASSGKKPKKEKKDKARDRLASVGRLPSDVSVESAAKGSAATSAGSASGAGNSSAGASTPSSGPNTPTKNSPARRPSERSVSVSVTANGGSVTPSRNSDLDLSSSSHTANNHPSHQYNQSHRDSPGPMSGSSAHLRSGSIDNSWSTRYRPSNIIDESVWRKAELTILNDAPPTRKRWEEYQAKYATKTEAAAGKSQKQSSSSNFKGSAGSGSSLNVKSGKSKDRSKQSSGDGRDMTPDSPRRKSNADDSSPRSSIPDSPRRKSNADDSGESPTPSSGGTGTGTDDKRSNYGRSDSVLRRPPPKLDAVEDSRVYLFEAPISESNLRFMDRNNEEVLAGGTIEKLIQHLTSASDPSPEYFQTFMLTYHNFLMPHELIELLRLRWNSQPSDPTKLELFVSKDLFPIRLRIVNVIRMWIETFSSDFRDEAAMNALNGFIDYIRTDNAQMADLVAVKVKKLQSGHIFDAEGEIDEDPPPIHLIAEGHESAPGLIDIHPEEFARQMTLVEHALFKSIPYKELLTNAKAGKANPNVSNMISYTNHLVNWVGTQILKQEDLRQRAIHLARFITIAKYCILSCQNYNGAMEVLSALRSSPVFRLKHTWNMLPDSVWDDYEWLEDLFESDNNYARYRKALSNAVPPCVPYLGRYLSEILFLNEIHPDYLSQGPPPMINFAKMSQVAEVLHHLQRYQKNPFCLTGVPIIQKFFLLKRGVINEKDLYKTSLAREPRESASNPPPTPEKEK